MITPIHLQHFSVIHPCLWVTNWNTNSEVAAHTRDSPAVAVQASSPNWANTRISPCKQTSTGGNPTHTDPQEWNLAWAPSVTSRGKRSWKSTEDTAGHTQEATSAGVSWAPQLEVDVVNTTRGKSLSHTSSFHHSYTKRRVSSAFGSRIFKY